MALVVMRFEDIYQHIRGHNLIGVVMHDFKHLTYGRGWEPHVEADVVKCGDFLFMLFLVNVHQEQKSMELHNTLRLGL